MVPSSSFVARKSNNLGGQLSTVRRGYFTDFYNNTSSRNNNNAITNYYNGSSTICMPLLPRKCERRKRAAEIFRRLRDKVRRLSFTSSSAIPYTNTDKTEPIINMDDEDLEPSHTYDETNVLEGRPDDDFNNNYKRDDDDDEDRDDNVTIESISVITTWTNQKGEKRRLLNHWKTRMKKSVKKYLYQEIDNEMQQQANNNEESAFPDTDDYAVPPHQLYKISTDRSRSAFHLHVPSLDENDLCNRHLEKSGWRGEDATTRALYSTDSEFPLYSSDLPIDRQQQKQEQQRHVGGASKHDWSTNKNQNKPLKEAALFVSFEDDCAQLVFHSPSFREAMQEGIYSEIEIDSVDSDLDYAPANNHHHNNEGANDDQDHYSASIFEYSYATNSLGATFSHPSGSIYAPPPLEPSASADMTTTTTTTNSSSKSSGAPIPLGIACGFNKAFKMEEQEQMSLMAQDYYYSNDNVIDPPSNVPQPRRRRGEDNHHHWKMSGVESEVTMSDTLVDPTLICRALNNDIPPLPAFPNGIKATNNKKDDEELYPYDEDAGLIKRKVELSRHPQEEKAFSSKIQNYVRGTLGYDKETIRQTNLQRKRPVCHCVKCTAAKIYYADLASSQQNGASAKCR